MKLRKRETLGDCARRLQLARPMVAPPAISPAISLAVILALPLAACVTGEIGDGIEPTTVSIGAASENGLSVNGLKSFRYDLSRFRTYRIAYVPGKESLNGLDPGSLLLNEEAAGDLPSTAEGRGLLKYIATCALPQDTALVVSNEGQEYVYPGLLNLAPEWVEGECGAECQGWVSACLLAHANPRGANVAISLRGSHPSLEATPEEAAAYTFEEAGYYAQLFGDEQELYACTGEDSFRNPLGAGGSWTRLCSSGQCGVSLVGTCTGIAGSSICNKEGGVYDSCRTSPSAFIAEDRSQVITVMLNPDTAPPF